MEDAPLPKLVGTPTKKEIIEIEKENKIYKLHIEIEESIMKFKIKEDDPFLGNYSRIFNIKRNKRITSSFFYDKFI